MDVVKVELEISFAGDRPSGTVRGLTGSPDRPFSGWLELMAALDELQAGLTHPGEGGESGR